MWWKPWINVSSKDEFLSTKGILQDIDPALWQQHRFGLSKSRWKRLEGRAFWISGAGTGYGRAVSVALAAAGATIFITGRRLKMLEDTISEASTFGINVERCYPLVADINSENQLESAIKLITQQTGKLSGLINCAALAQPLSVSYPLFDLSIESWNEIIQTNVTGQWLATKAALPLLTSGNEARVLFFSSAAGWADTAGFGPYNITKAAVNSLGISFAAECKSKFPSKDIQINVIDPGEARTEMNRGSEISAYSVASIVLTLLSHPSGGPNGKFFHRDGRHTAFGFSSAYKKDLLEA